MSLNRAHIQYVLNQFDAGASPHRILDCLQNSAFLPWLTLANVEQCLCENGRIKTFIRSSNIHHDVDEAAQGYQSTVRLGRHHAMHSNNILPVPPACNQTQRAPGISAATTTEEVYQVPANNNNNPAIQTFATDAAVADPGPAGSWNELADIFVMTAYQRGHSLVDIWAMLQTKGYKVTQAEVKESVTRQLQQIAG